MVEALGYMLTFEILRESVDKFADDVSQNFINFDPFIGTITDDF